MKQAKPGVINEITKKTWLIKYQIATLLKILNQ